MLLRRSPTRAWAGRPTVFRGRSSRVPHARTRARRSRSRGWQRPESPCPYAPARPAGPIVRVSDIPPEGTNEPSYRVPARTPNSTVQARLLDVSLHALGNEVPDRAALRDARPDVRR